MTDRGELHAFAWLRGGNKRWTPAGNTLEAAGSGRGRPLRSGSKSGSPQPSSLASCRPGPASPSPSSSSYCRRPSFGEALLLRKPEVRPASDQLHGQLVEADAPLLGDLCEMPMQIRAGAESVLAAVGLLLGRFRHPHDGTACGTMLATTKRARGVDAPSPLLTEVDPMSSNNKHMPVVGGRS